MKTFFTFCFLLLSAFTLNAQDLTFEQTLDYLNKAAKNGVSPIRYGGMFSGVASGKPDINSTEEMIDYLKHALRSFGTSYVIGSVVVSKNGNFSLRKGEGEDQSVDYFNLFKLNQGFLLFENNIVYSSRKREIGYLQFVNDKEASRFFKALQHISSFCKEEKDPFDN